MLFLKAYHEVAESGSRCSAICGLAAAGRAVASSIATATGRTTALNKSVILREADEAGYRLLEEHDDLVKDDKMDYFLVLGVK